MQRNNAFVQITSIMLGVFMLSACQPAAQPESNVQFKAPDRILQVRSIDRSQLSPTVRLSTGETFTMVQTGEDSWSGTINVIPNNSYFVTVDWKETLPDNETRPNAELLLATWSDTVTVEANGTVVNLSGSNYDYELDDDGDTISNLNERQDDTDPFVFNVIPADSEDDSVDEVDQTDGGITTDETSTTDVTDTTDGTDDDELADTGTTTDGSVGNSTVGSITTAGQTAGTTGDGETDSEPTTTGGSTGVTLAQASVLIPRIRPQDAPDIDGEGVSLNRAGTALTGEWANAVQNDNAGAGLWINNLLVDNRTTTIDSAVDGEQLHRWAAMHDGVNLYVVVLADDVGLRSSDSDQIWQDDALELFIDGNNSKLTSWGDADDFHYLIALQREDSNLANNEFSPRVDLGPGPKSERFDFSFSTGPGVGPDGVRFTRFEQDVYELAIPIADAGITIGQPFGFELQIDDDDNGDGRDAKWGWFNPSLQGNGISDITYLDPSVMGTLILEE